MPYRISLSTWCHHQRCSNYRQRESFKLSHLNFIPTTALHLEVSQLTVLQTQKLVYTLLCSWTFVFFLLFHSVYAYDLIYLIVYLYSTGLTLEDLLYHHLLQWDSVAWLNDFLSRLGGWVGEVWNSLLASLWTIFSFLSKWFRQKRPKGLQGVSLRISFSQKDNHMLRNSSICTYQLNKTYIGAKFVLEC